MNVNGVRFPANENVRTHAQEFCVSIGCGSASAHA